MRYIVSQAAGHLFWHQEECKDLIKANCSKAMCCFRGAVLEWGCCELGVFKRVEGKERGVDGGKRGWWQ